MAIFKVKKVVSALPDTLDPDTIYLVRVGSGFAFYCSDSTGSVAHRLNDPSVATTSADGLMSSSDKSKLDGIAAGAQVNVATNLAQGTRTTTTVPVTSSTGTSATLDVATTSLAGMMSSADKTKLDGIATGANNYSHPTGDGNLHVPATSTTNNGKVLKAGATAGSIAWDQLDKTDVGLTNVDNTSDLSKPISTLTQAALDLKSATSHTHAYLPLSGGTVTGKTVFNDRVRFGTATTYTDSVLTAAANFSANQTSNLVRNNLTISDEQLNAGRTISAVYNMVDSSLQCQESFSLAAYGSINYARTTTVGGYSVNAYGKLCGIFGFADHRTTDSTYYRMELISGGEFTGQVSGSTARGNNVLGVLGSAVVSGATSYIENAYGVRASCLAMIAGGTIANAYLFDGYFNTTGTIANKYGVFIDEDCNNYLTGLQLGGTVPTGGGNCGLGVGKAATGLGKIDTTDNISTEKQLVSTVASGTAPVAVTSNTLVANLNADLLDGQHASTFSLDGHYHDEDLYVNALLAADTNLDDLSDNAIYPVTSALGSLPTSNNCFVLNLNYDVNKKFQLYFHCPNVATGKLYTRQRATDGTWTAWNQVAFTSDIDTIINSGLHPSVGRNLFFDPSTGTASANGRSIYGLASYRSAVSTTTGAIVFTAPASNVDIMHYFDVSGYLYNKDIISLKVQGYRQTADFVNMVCVNTGTIALKVRLGIDASGKTCLVLGDTTTVWSYPHIAIMHSLFSHTNISDAYCQDWTVSLITDETVPTVFTYLSSEIYTQNIASGAGDWKYITASQNAIIGEGYLVNTTSGAITLTLPAAPLIGCSIKFCDCAGMFDSKNLTIARNELKIMGLAEDMVVSTKNASFELVYSGVTFGWRIV